MNLFFRLFNVMFFLILCSFDVHASTVDTVVDEYFYKKAESISETLLKTPEMISFLKEKNMSHQKLSLEQIEAMDESWVRAETVGDNSLLKNTLNNKASDILKKYQKNHPEFVEIFITDKFGLNVAQTNRTSDYYQADEKWWVDTYDEGRGVVHYGDVEYDISSQTESISLYIPIFDSKNQKVIGILKGVIRLGDIKVK